ncbi:MAG: metal-sensitive transcriptional regulator [Omnitrophica WOR_2 bacterium]
MKIQNQDVKQKLIRRLHRVEGQVRGVENMLDEERDCHEILQQLSAIHSAVEGASRVFFQEYATICMAEMEEEESSLPGVDLSSKRTRIIQDMIQLFNKTP